MKFSKSGASHKIVSRNTKEVVGNTNYLKKGYPSREEKYIGQFLTSCDYGRHRVAVLKRPVASLEKTVQVLISLPEHPRVC